MIYFQKLTKQLRLTFFSPSYTIDFILLHNCFNTVILAEPSLHHNIILEKLDHWCVSRICTTIVIPYSHTSTLFHIYARNEQKILLAHFFFVCKFFSFISTSYWIWSWAKDFAGSFFFRLQILFLQINFILDMKLSKRFCWLISV